MDQHLEIQKAFREQQQKFIYYEIALTVTAIGFSIIKTSGLPLSWTQIPLALAVICWGLSIYFGLKFLKFSISSLYAQDAYFTTLKGNNPEVGSNPGMIKAAISGLTSAIESNSTKASRIAKRQDRLLVIGAILFLTWHIIEMSTIAHK